MREKEKAELKEGKTCNTFKQKNRTEKGNGCTAKIFRNGCKKTEGKVDQCGGGGNGWEEG